MNEAKEEYLFTSDKQQVDLYGRSLVSFRDAVSVPSIYFYIHCLISISENCVKQLINVLATEVHYIFLKRDEIKL